MNAPVKTINISPAALIQTIKVNLGRRPLWSPETIQDFLDLTHQEVMRKIESGVFPVAFNVGSSRNKAEPRVLALSVVETQLGPIPPIGATKNLNLPQVFDLILPKRDIRSTELKRILNCGNDWFRQQKPAFVITREPTVQDGPNSYCQISRASVTKFLEKRRMT